MNIRKIIFSSLNSYIFREKIEEFVDLGYDSYDGSSIFDEKIEECTNMCNDSYDGPPIF